MSRHREWKRRRQNKRDDKGDKKLDKGREYFLPRYLRSSGSVVSSGSGIRGRAPAVSTFWWIFSCENASGSRRFLLFYCTKAFYRDLSNCGWNKILLGQNDTFDSEIFSAAPFGVGAYQCSRIRIFRFFFRFQKMTFYVFLKWLWKKRKKSVAKILSSMMLTLLKNKKKSLLNVYTNFGLKTPGCYGYV